VELMTTGASKRVGGSGGNTGQPAPSGGRGSGTEG
jgi:hypothetical protein